MVIAGAVCATMLAELGADVIKVESPAMPDSVRRIRMADPAVHEPSGAPTSAMFASYNRSVRSLALDMKQPESVNLVLRLARQADMVIENFSPGVVERWGLGYDKIAAVNPQIVMLSQTGFGQTGPRSHYLAYASTVFSFVGLTQIWGHSHPTAHDYPSAAHGLFAILAALAARDRTGLGIHIDQARSRSRGRSWARCCSITSSTGTNPVKTRRPGWWSPVSATTAGWPSNQKTRATGSSWPRWSARRAAATTPRSAKHCGHGPGRLPAAGHADAAEGRPSGRRRPEQRGRNPRPAAPRAPFPAGNGSPGSGRSRCAGPPHRLSKTPATIKRRTPRLGEHTTEILTEWLGMAPEESQLYTWPPASRTQA